jgi:hypothetical protein
VTTSRLDADLIYPIELSQPYADVLARSGRDVAAYVISSNWQLPMAAVHQHGEPNGARPSKITKCIQRCSHGTPGVEHIIDQYHGAVLHLDRQVSVANCTGGLPAQVVAVHGHVQRAYRHADAFHVIHYRGESMGQRHTTGRNPQQYQTFSTPVDLKYLVSDPSTGPGNLLGIHHYSRRFGTDRSAGARIIALGLWRAGT